DYLRKHAAEQLNEKGELLYGVWDRIGRDLKNLGTQTVDYDATRKVIAEAMQGKESALKAWAEKLILPLHASPSLTLRGRKVPYTLDNIV
ncbi:hypothetical protein U2063_15345, partial [Listeria monocytogenes]|uniref:hypothetical protein n=1 Tax=Listeria monocytogenes TaxID=1639 RepID=UPI002FDC674D